MRTLLVLALSTAAAGPADSPAQKDGWAEMHRQLDTKIAQVNSTCGADLEARYAVKTYPDDWALMSDRTSGQCLQATDSLKAICATPSGKEAVQALSGVTCAFSTEGTGAKKRKERLVIGIDIVNTSVGSWKTEILGVL